MSHPRIRDYTDYPELAGLYLKDSYVLGIFELPNEVRFDLEAVLTRQHPAYHDPLPGEQYCYAKGNLVFAEVTEVQWLSRSGRQFTDATGEVDLGNIDALSNDDGVFAVEGDWGRVRIRSDSAPRFDLS
ncbi:hypothetical protein ACWIGI_31115 [Nocardia sp. NPDC055321]